MNESRRLRRRCRTHFCLWILTSSFAIGCAANRPAPVECGIPPPNANVKLEWIDEADRAIAGAPPLLPHSHEYHKRLAGLCNW